MDLNHKAAEELAEMTVWLDDSLGYAREHRQRKMVWLLEAVRVEVKLEDALLTLPLREHLGSDQGSAREKAMHKEQRVADMATTVLTRQAGARAERTGEPRLEALKAVLETEAGQQLVGLRDGPYRDEEVKHWHDELALKRAKKRRQARQEET